MLRFNRIEDTAKVSLGPCQRPQPVGFAALRVNRERHLVDRQAYKQRLSVALAEWHSILR